MARVESDGDADIAVLRFEWEHRGTPGDGHDPDVSVTAIARTREPRPSADEVARGTLSMGRAAGFGPPA